MIDHPIACSATFQGKPVSCEPRLWYAPRLKPFLEIGNLPNVSFQQAMLERPWRLLDLGLLGEEGPLHFWAGVGCSFLLALGCCAWFRRGGLWRVVPVALGAFVFVLLNAAWFMQCVFLGYID